MEPRNPEKLEQSVHAALRALPDRRAPASLAARVQAEIERRAAIPWWHKPYAYWPSWARGTFLAGAGAGVIALMVFVMVNLNGGLEGSRLGGALAPAIAFARRVYGVGAWIGDLGSLIFSSVPPLWLYGGLAIVAAMYLSLVGLGATAYRLLWTRQ
jgi:hypothetical protein